MGCATHQLLACLRGVCMVTAVAALACLLCAWDDVCGLWPQQQLEKGCD